MPIDTKNKNIVVTGGADGIGFQIVRHFLKGGAEGAIIVDINEDLGNKAAASLNSEFGDKKVIFIKYDVTHNLDEVFSEIFKHEIDVLVNSAGVVSHDPDRSIDINLKATVKWSLKFMEFKRKDKGGNGGTIINISSIYGYDITPVYPIYNATKYGVIGFTRSLGHLTTYEKTGVRVIALCPGFTKTNLAKEVFDPASPEHIKKAADTEVWQSAEEVGEKAIEVYGKADSGTMWEIKGGEVSEVTM